MDRILSIIKKIIPDKVFKSVQPAYHYLMAGFSSFVYRYPSEKMVVIGVTGTTGKTTSVYLIAQLLKKAGYKAGYTSTAMFSNGKEEWNNNKKMTMVGRFFTQKILSQMQKNGCHFAIVETTSEGVRQFRHRFINYDFLIFTGLYPEHIESHGSFENYKKAKGDLFAHLKNCKTKYINEESKVMPSKKEIKKLDLKRVKKTIIANLDDEHADYFLSFWAERKMGYTQNRQPNNDFDSSVEMVYYGEVSTEKNGLSFQTEGEKIKTNLLGDFNAINAMNAICVGKILEIGINELKNGMEKIKGAPGRLETIDKGQDFTVIVDYAFEPKALAKLYENVKIIEHNQVIHVLGSAGGGRDANRRPVLGKIAGQNADKVIITNEDPYDDDPELIIDQVMAGAETSGKKKDKNLFKIMDRREAINKALSLAQKGDIVLITGKGNEQAICIEAGKKIPWDDRKAVKEELKKII